MDANQFDSIAKGVAGTSTRRSALGTALAGGLLTALGLKAAPLAAQDEQKQQKQPKDDQSDQPQVTCVLDFTATVRQGPTANGNAGQVKGELTFSLTGKGSLDNASLRLASGTSVPVVGQATGPSLQLRMQLGTSQTLIAIGVGERDIADCQGAVDGIATGPATGDLGDWHATVLRATGAAGGGKDRDQNAGAGEAGAAGGAGGKQKQPKQPKQGGQGGQGSSGGQTGGHGGGRDDGATSPSGPSGPSGPTSETGQTAATPTVPLCAEHESECNGACVDTSSDAANCGLCGHACATGEECVGSVCQLGQSASCTVQGLTDCNGTCVDLTTDANNCGACGTVCASGEECIDSACSTMASPPATTCDQGLTDCNGVCVDLTTDTSNCGACGVACATGESCSGGACAATTDCAAQGLTDCNGVCVDIMTDAANCGACGAVCGTGEECGGGFCSPAEQSQTADCSAQGLTDCGGTCIDIANDPNNCGGCGLVCPQGASCSAGVCISVQAPVTDCASQGLTDCGGVCVDITTDSVNCGGCGIVCATQCSGGVCS